MAAFRRAYLLHQIVNLIPADRLIETDLAATESFISALPNRCCRLALMRGEINSNEPATTPVHVLLFGHSSEVSQGATDTAAS